MSFSKVCISLLIAGGVLFGLFVFISKAQQTEQAEQAQKQKDLTRATFVADSIALVKLRNHYPTYKAPLRMKTSKDGTVRFEKSE